MKKGKKQHYFCTQLQNSGDIGYTLENEFYDEEPSEVLEEEFME